MSWGGDNRKPKKPANVKPKGEHVSLECPNCGGASTYKMKDGKRYCNECKKTYYVVA